MLESRGHEMIGMVVKRLRFVLGFVMVPFPPLASIDRAQIVQCWPGLASRHSTATAATTSTSCNKVVLEAVRAALHRRLIHGSSTVLLRFYLSIDEFCRAAISVQSLQPSRLLAQAQSAHNECMATTESRKMIKRYRFSRPHSFLRHLKSRVEGFEGLDRRQYGHPQ